MLGHIRHQKPTTFSSLLINLRYSCHLYDKGLNNRERLIVVQHRKLHKKHAHSIRKKKKIKNGILKAVIWTDSFSKENIKLIFQQA